LPGFIPDLAMKIPRILRPFLTVLGVALVLVVAMAGVGLAGRGATASPPAAAAPVPPQVSRLDATISQLQERLRAQPNSQRAYVQLGDAYLQKARESGDPTYYTKAEAVLNRSLSLVPDEFQSLALMGTLALARHQFRDGLVWGARARALNPYSAVALAVIGDA